MQYKNTNNKLNLLTLTRLGTGYHAQKNWQPIFKVTFYKFPHKKTKKQHNNMFLNKNYIFITRKTSLKNVNIFLYKNKKTGCTSTYNQLFNRFFRFKIVNL